MKKLLLAFVAAGAFGFAAIGSSTGAEAKWGGGHGFKSHGFKAHHGHFGYRHFGHRHWGHRWGGVRVVTYGYGSCWRSRWTPYGYRYVNVCLRPLY